MKRKYYSTVKMRHIATRIITFEGPACSEDQVNSSTAPCIPPKWLAPLRLCAHRHALFGELYWQRDWLMKR
jgi:hypothetical protein